MAAAAGHRLVASLLMGRRALAATTLRTTTTTLRTTTTTLRTATAAATTRSLWTATTTMTAAGRRAEAAPSAVRGPLLLRLEQRRSMFIQTETTPNEDSLKFRPGVPVMGEGYGRCGVAHECSEPGARTHHGEGRMGRGRQHTRLSGRHRCAGVAAGAEAVQDHGRAGRLFRKGLYHRHQRCGSTRCSTAPASVLRRLISGRPVRVRVCRRGRRVAAAQARHFRDRHGLFQHEPAAHP